MDDKVVAVSGSKPQLHPNPIPVDTLKRLVLLALGARGAIYPIRHCKDNMIEREFDMSDIVHILETGNYGEYLPVWKDDYQNWLYFVLGEDLEDKRLKVVFSVEEADSKIRIVSGERFYGGKRV